MQIRALTLFITSVFATAGLALGATVAVSYAVQNTSKRTGASTMLASRSETGPAPSVPCGQYSVPIGYIALLSPGHQVAELANSGIPAVQLHAAGSEGLSSTVITAPPAQSWSKSGPARANSSLALPAVSASALIYPQAKEPQLQSCDYQLSDRPAAQPYLRSAEQELLNLGLVTSAQVQSVPWALLSDDQLDPSAYIVTIAVLGPPMSTANTPAGVEVLSSLRFEVIEEATSTTVTAYGQAAWA